MLARVSLPRLAAPIALAVLLAVLLAARGAPAAPAAPAALPALAASAEISWADSPGGQLVFFAVLEGLYTDGVQPELVRAVLEGPPRDGVAEPRALETMLFVPGCPLCTPAQVAFETYAARGPLHMKDWHADGRPRDTFGPGLSDAVAARLQSPSRPVRLAALEELIATWIARRLDLGRATANEREQFRAWMEGQRKVGMEQLAALRNDLDAATSATWPQCASCDGAVAGCVRR